MQQQLQNQRISTRPAFAADPAASSTSFPPAPAATVVQASTAEPQLLAATQGGTGPQPRNAEPENIFPRPAQPAEPAAALSTHPAAAVDINAVMCHSEPPSISSVPGDASQRKHAAVGVKLPEHKPMEHASYHVASPPTSEPCISRVQTCLDACCNQIC